MPRGVWELASACVVVRTDLSFRRVIFEPRAEALAGVAIALLAGGPASCGRLRFEGPLWLATVASPPTGVAAADVAVGPAG